MSATTDDTVNALFDSIGGAREAATVRKVFGDAYEVDGLTIIPVARVGGAGGGGAGTEAEKDEGGFGSGFALRASPVGVYEVRDGEVVWKPATDIGKLAKGGQVLTGIIAVCITLVLVLRRRQ